MSNLKISTRLILLVSLLAFMMMVIGKVGLSALLDANAGLKTVYEDRTVSLGQLLNVQRLLLRNRVSINNALAVATPENIKSQTEQIAPTLKQLDQSWNDYMATQLTPKEAEIANALAVAKEKYTTEYVRQAEAALKNGDLALVRKLLVERDDDLYMPVRRELVKLTELQLEVAKDEYGQSQSRFERARIIEIALLLLGIAFAVFSDGA